MSRARWLIFLLIAGAAIVLVGGAVALLSRLSRPAASPYTQFNSAALVTQVQGLAQLVTVKYVMEKVVVLEDVRLWGENRILLVAHGVVKAGVNLAELDPEDLEIRGAKVTLRLPPAMITDCYLDEDRTEVIEHTTGLLRRFDRDLEQTARREGLDAIRRAARYSGILAEADQRAELQLTAFFRALGFGDVEIRR